MSALYTLTIASVIFAVNGQEHQLIQFMFDGSRYDKRISPNDGYDLPLNVTVGLTVQRIVSLDEKRQQLLTHAVLHLTWRDQRLSWDKKQFGFVESITIKTQQIWLPDIVLFNSASATHSTGKISQIQPTIHHTGMVAISCPLLLRTTCKFDVRNYPLDEQKCQLVFGSWGHNSKQIRVNSMPDEFNKSRNIDNGQWKIQVILLNQQLTPYEGGEANYYEVKFEITLSRRVLYYTMYLIVPGALITSLTGIIFLLPQDCSERITVGMAILVALSFFYLLVSEAIPPSSENSIVGKFYAIAMVEMTISCFLNVLVLRFHHMTETRVPDWVKKYILNYGARLLRIKFPVNRKVKLTIVGYEESDRKIKQATTKLSKEIIYDDKIIANVLETQIKMAERDQCWKEAAEILNVYSFVIHVIFVVLTFCVVFLT